MLFLDSVYVARDNGTPRFREPPARQFRDLPHRSRTATGTQSIHAAHFAVHAQGEGRFTGIDSGSLLNVDTTYTAAAGNWTLSAYGRNVTDERYDQGRLQQQLEETPSEVEPTLIAADH